jgi:arginine decarboxylase-like protein
MMMTMMMMMMTMMMMMMKTTTTTMMMMMKDAFEDKRTVSSKFKSGETGKEERNRSMKFKCLFCAALSNC